MDPVLRILAPNQPPVEFVLDVSLIHLGREAGNDIVVKVPQVSAHHLELRREGDGFRLTDKDSSNGTKVNGERVTTVLLQDGDELLIGGAVFGLYTVEKEERQPETPIRSGGNAPMMRPPIKIARPMPPGARAVSSR